MVARKAVGAALCALFLLAGPLAAWAQPSIGQYQRQERQVEGQISAAQASYQQARDALAAAEARVRRLDGEMVAGAQNLQRLSSDVGLARREAERRQRAADAALAKQRASASVADRALVTVYVGSRVSYLDVLFGATSFSDFVTRAAFLWSVWMRTLNLLRQAEADRREADRLAAAARAALVRLQGLENQAALQLERLRARSAAAKQAWQAEQAAAARVHAAIQALLKEKAGLQAAIERLLAQLRSGKLDWGHLMQLVDALGRQYGLDPRLIEAVIIQESGGDARARSSAGALGLMQLMPGTAAALGVQDPLDPVQNVRGGITYLLEMLQRFHGNLALALAAYNAGPGAVEKYGGIPPYAETQRYVQDVLKLYQEGR
jgi:soluble lytic murein transglycosylase-like protein